MLTTYRNKAVGACRHNWRDAGGFYRCSRCGEQSRGPMVRTTATLLPAVMDGEREAGACQIDLPDGRRIWCPPTGRPFWVGAGNDLRELTDAEMAEYGL